MLSSLPVIHPRDSHTLWYTPSSTFSYAPPPASQNSSGDTSHGHSDPSQLQSRNNNNNANQNVNPRRPNAIGPLRQLELEETFIENRKASIQFFGSTWIKPPGLLKTYQGELDEKAEREEAVAREQDEMANLTFLQEGGEEGEEQDLDAGIPEGSEAEDEEDEGDGDELGEDEYGDLDEEDEEVDLDAEIPEAEQERLWSDSDEENEDEDEDEEEEDEDDYEMGYASTGGDVTSSTRDGTERTDESPQQAMFSHDESYPEEPRRSRAHGLDWRASARQRRSIDDSMDLDSD